MKRILVMSDTHGNQPYLREVCLSEKFDVFFHLGDDYSDLDNNSDLTDTKKVFKVPGLMNNLSQDEAVPMIQHITVENWRFQLVHRQEDIEYITPPDDVVLFGHTHHPSYQFRKGILYANPGHLKSSHHRNHHASYLMITLDKEKMNLDWKDLNGQVFEQQTFTRADWHK